ncbi:MAG: 1-acyl-sn-glycerol-3-phosphate acyltransferase [Fibrobacteres bacterium]|nr:1-acyl-sn-glycerol-3-phosphate acyltransferase [Fibrobacterota bacterium]
MSAFLRLLFFLCIIRPIIMVILGLNIRRRELLPTQGPAVLAANHNSHLDTMVLITMMPLRLLRKVRPVAAADYFLRNGLLAWFSLSIIGIIPIRRKKADGAPDSDPLEPCYQALARGDILIFFPEGTRGEPESISGFKSGICKLGKRFPEMPVIPIFMHGLGKSLPKGEGILVPHFVDVFVGEPLRYEGKSEIFKEELEARMLGLAKEGDFPAWK